MKRLTRGQAEVGPVRSIEVEWSAVRHPRWRWERRTFHAWDMWLMGGVAAGLAVSQWMDYSPAAFYGGLLLLAVFASPVRLRRHR